MEFYEALLNEALEKEQEQEEEEEGKEKELLFDYENRGNLRFRTLNLSKFWTVNELVTNILKAKQQKSTSKFFKKRKEFNSRKAMIEHLLNCIYDKYNIKIEKIISLPKTIQLEKVIFKCKNCGSEEYEQLHNITVVCLNEKCGYVQDFQGLYDLEKNPYGIAQAHRESLKSVIIDKKAIDEHINKLRDLIDEQLTGIIYKTFITQLKQLISQLFQNSTLDLKTKKYIVGLIIYKKLVRKPNLKNFLIGIEPSLLNSESERSMKIKYNTIKDIPELTIENLQEFISYF